MATPQTQETARRDMDNARPAAAAVATDAGVAKALAQVSAMLVAGEVIQTYAVQRRLYALFHRRTIVAATSGRLLVLTRELFGGYALRDVRWQDIKEVRLGAGIFTALLTVVSYSQPDLAVNGQLRRIDVDGLRKAEAEGVYRICQGNEQAWREKRRVRELEEMRAKSGGMQIGGSLPGGPAPMDAGPVQKLAQAKEMLNQGLISDAEYESLKARIVSAI
jgi:hypothetical protein